MAGTDFSHLTTDELIKGIKALDLPDYIRSKAYGVDVRETLAQMTEMTIQLGVNMGLSPDDALKWARKLQESVSQSEFDSWVATLLDGGPSIFMNTLSELQSTYPNGASGVALVRETDPAKIYVWTGSAWENFGDYQGIEIKDGSVSLPKVSEVSLTGNLYDKHRDLINGYIHSEGHFIVSESTRTAEVKVVPGQPVSILRPAGNSYGAGFGLIQLLKSNGDLIDSLLGSEYINGTYNGLNYITINLPKEAEKIRITVLLGAMDSVDGLVVSQGSSIDADSYGKPELKKIFGMNIQDEYARSTLKGYENGSYNNKKWVAFGDSLTERNSKSSQFYHDYIREELNLEVVNMGSGGSGYKLKEDTGFAFYQRILNVPQDADFITIFGSLNDSAADAPIGSASDVGTDTIAGCVNKTIDNLYSVNPIMPLGIISPTPWNSSVLSDENNRHTQYARMLKEVCEIRGIPFLDLYFESGLRPWESSYREIVYSNDGGNGVHPNEIGHRIIAPKIREFIKTLI